MNEDTQHMVARGDAVLVMADRRIESAEIHYEPSGTASGATRPRS